MSGKGNKGKGISRRTFLKTAAGTAASFALFSGGFKAWSQSTAKVGFLAPLGMEEGNLAQQGASLGASLINKSHKGIALDAAGWTGIPGLGGSSLEVAFADHEGDPKKAVSLVEEMKSAGAAAVIGAIDDYVMAEASAAAAEVGLPFLDATSIDPYLTRRGLDGYFRMNAHNLFATQLFFNMAKQYNVDQEDFLFVTESKPGVEEDIEIMKAHTDRLGYNLQSLVLDAVSEEEVTEAANSIMASEPDAIILDLTPEWIAATIEGLTEMEEDARPSAVLVDQYTRMKDDLTELLSEDVRQGFSWSFINVPFIPLSPEASGPGPAVDQLFQDEYGEKLSAPAALALEGVHTCARLLNQAESTESADIIEVASEFEAITEEMVIPWRGIDFSSVENFGDQGQNIMALPIVARLDEEGEYEIAGGGGVGPLGFTLKIGNFLGCKNTICLYL